MFSELGDKNIIFFSPAENRLPRHIRINFWPVRFIKQVGISIWVYLNVFRIISRFHLEKLNVHSGAGGVLLPRRVPIPVIVTCHHTYRQQYNYIKSQFWKRIFIPFEARTYRLANRIVCVSEDTKRSLVDGYGISEEKITVIYNAVDIGRFHPLETDKLPNSLLYIGRIDTRKGIEFLIRSMPLVVRQIPDVRLLVGGKGASLQKMKSLVTLLNLEKAVTFLGFVPDDRLNELYNRAQCVIVPSIFEGFGISVIEAIAAGVRVVGTDVDGIREILKSGEYGSLVAYGNYQTMADTIVSELRNPRKAQQLGAEYLLDQFRDRYLEVLEDR